MRLLCADDSPTICKLVEICLRGTGFVVDFASTGHEAVTRALAGPDVLLLDYILPDMKAPDVCRRLAADPRTAQIKVVLLSSKDASILHELRQFPQVVGYLAKPFSGDDLIARLTAAWRLSEGSSRAPAAAAPKPGQESPGSAAAKVSAGHPHTPLPPASGFQPGGIAAYAETKLSAEPSHSSPPAAPGPQPANLAPADALERSAAGESFRLKEAVVTAIYARLRTQLERLPAWAAERGDQSPGAYFARKLLTPEVVDGLLFDLAPFCRDARPLEGLPGGELDTRQREPEGPRRLTSGNPADATSVDLDLVYARDPSSIGKLGLYQLSAVEKRVLKAVDGDAPIRLLSERTDVELREVERTLSRLCTMKLIQPCAIVRPMREPTVRVLAVLDHDREGMHGALEGLLRRLPDPVEVRDLLAEANPLAAIERDRPCLVLLNDEGTKVDMADLARQIRRRNPLAHIVLAAVLERPRPELIDPLLAAGFDTVCVKPLHFREVSQLMTEAFLAVDQATGTAQLSPNGPVGGGEVARP